MEAPGRESLPTSYRLARLKCMSQSGVLNDRLAIPVTIAEFNLSCAGTFRGRKKLSPEGANDISPALQRWEKMEIDPGPGGTTEFSQRAGRVGVTPSAAGMESAGGGANSCSALRCFSKGGTCYLPELRRFFVLVAPAIVGLIASFIARRFRPRLTLRRCGRTNLWPGRRFNPRFGASRGLRAGFRHRRFHSRLWRRGLTPVLRRSGL